MLSSKPHASEIVPGLFIGNVYSSFDEPFLREHNIKYILSAIHESWPKWQRRSFLALIPPDRHLQIACHDSSTQDLLVYLTEGCDFIEESLKHGPVLVHCSEGISRSTTFVIAYLMRKQRRGVQELLAEVKEKRKRVKPKENFLAQLELWQELDYDVWEDRDKKVPKAAYAKMLEEKNLTVKTWNLWDLDGITMEPIGCGEEEVPEAASPILMEERRRLPKRPANLSC